MKVHAHEIAYVAIFSELFEEISALLHQITTEARRYSPTVNFAPDEVFFRWFQNDEAAKRFRLWLEWLQADDGRGDKTAARQRIQAWEMHGFGGNDNGDPRHLPDPAAYKFAMAELSSIATVWREQNPTWHPAQ